MIGHLHGVLAEKTPTRITVDVHGVGYEVLIPVTTYENLGEVGDSVKLLTYLNVRDDALQLFGFYSQKERWMFNQLILVSGVGPKLALSILSGSSVDELQRYIAGGEVDSLTRLSGVGRKTAQRLVTELREKLGGEEPSFEAMGTLVDANLKGKYEEALAALLALGYSRATAQKALEGALQRDREAPVEELVKQALQTV